jgi:hypothetical protein
MRANDHEIPLTLELLVPREINVFYLLRWFSKTFNETFNDFFNNRVGDGYVAS